VMDCPRPHVPCSISDAISCFRYAFSADTQGMMCFWDIAEAAEINSVKVMMRAHKLRCVNCSNDRACSRLLHLCRCRLTRFDVQTAAGASACCVSSEATVALCDVEGRLHLFQPQGFEDHEMAGNMLARAVQRLHFSTACCKQRL
jgi:ribosomal protein S14